MRRTDIVPLLGVVFTLFGCSSGYSAAKIDDPRKDLETDRVADGPDGTSHQLVGEASWYGKKFHGRTTASGEPYDMYRFTAAHRSLPFHTVVRVTERATRKSVVVRINDRGPFVDGRVIDLSWAAARDLGLTKKGPTPVQLEVVEWGDGSRVQDD